MVYKPIAHILTIYILVIDKHVPEFFYEVISCKQIGTYMWGHTNGNRKQGTKKELQMGEVFSREVPPLTNRNTIGDNLLRKVYCGRIELDK